MPRRKASTEHTAPDSLAHLSDEELSHHPFIELMARWVIEAEQERRAREQAPGAHATKHGHAAERATQ